MVSQISVIIPAYNRASLIGETLRSLLNQTMPAKEIIVVDDGSTDGTAEKTLEAFENWKLETGNWKKDVREQFSGNSKSDIQNPTFKILRQANAGPGAARNRGLAEATGEFIHFFDSDDIAAPNKHEVQLEALLRTGADIAYGPWVKGRFASKEAQMVAGDEFHAEARRRGDFKFTTEDTENTEEEAVLSLGKPSGAAFSNLFTSELARDSENTSLTRGSSAPAYRFSGFKFQISGFSAIGPVLQAWGLPKGDLIKALLTNWSIVPHACLFRRSIVERAEGFPEDIWVGEDQLLFLRCLLAAAKVVHTPETLVLYRLGEEGKLTESKEGHVRRVTHWARFLVKASQEVGSHAEARRRGDFVLTTKDTESTELTAGQRLDKPSVAAFSNPLPSELGRDCANTSPIRSADVPAVAQSKVGIGSAGGNQLADSKRFWKGQSQAGLQMDSPNLDSISSPNETRAWREQSDKNPVNFVNPVKSLKSVKNGFGFRLRAYEAWRDLEKFFPNGEDQSKNDLQGIWKKNRFSGLGFQVLGFVFRILGGVKLRIMGYREHAAFKCAEFSAFSEN